MQKHFIQIVGQNSVVDTINTLVVDLMKTTHILNLIILNQTNNHIFHGLASSVKSIKNPIIMLFNASNVVKYKNIKTPFSMSLSF